MRSGLREWRNVLEGLDLSPMDDNWVNLDIEEAADRIARALRCEPESLKQFGILFGGHLVDAHAKWMTGKWFRWRLTTRDRQRATIDLMRKYAKRVPYVSETGEEFDVIEAPL